MKALRFAFLALLVFVFSCDNGFNSYSGFSSAPESKNHTVKCYISLDGAVPEEIASAAQDDSLREGSVRSAVPTVNTTDYYYFVEAVKSDGTKKEYGKEQAANFSTTTSLGTVAFEFSLSDGSWTVTSGLKNNSDVTVLSYTLPEPVVITPDETVADLHFNIAPQAGGEGTIQLGFYLNSLGTDFAISHVKAQCDSTAWKTVNSNSTTCELAAGAGSGGDYVLNIPSIASGAYPITFTFYGSSDIILYQTTQTINVLSGMTTKRWVSGGGSDDVVIDEGKLTVSTDAINDFARRVFYVGDTYSGGTKIGTAADDGEGTAYKPFNSFEKALATIEKTKSTSKDYKIFLSGNQTFSGSDSISSCWTVPEGIKSLSIIGSNEATLNGNTKGTVIRANSNLILKDVKITGGSGANGGGIYVASGSTVTMKQGAVVAGNTAHMGGGVYVAGEFILDGGTIGDAGKTEHATSLQYSNSAIYPGSYSFGGGIFFTNTGKVTIKSGIIAYNFAYRGGGISCNHDYSSNSKLTIEGGEIRHNCSSSGETIHNNYSFGGGVFNNGAKFTLKGGEIHNNFGQDGGGGLFLQSTSSAIMTGGSIHDNEYNEADADAWKNGTDLLLWADAELSMTGGSIDSTTEKLRGVQLCETTDVLKMSGTARIGKNTPVLLGKADGSVQTYLTVEGNLTAPSDGSKNAYIVPAQWKRGIQVLKAATAKLVEDNASRFGTIDDDYEVAQKGATATGVIYAPVVVGVNDSASYDAATVRGTLSEPYKTIEDALFNAVDSETTEITIKGTVSKQAISSWPATGSASGVTAITLKGKDSDSKINAANLGSAFTMNVSGKSVIIKDLTLTGGNGSDLSAAGTLHNGGGIYINAGTVKLADGAVVTGNSVTTNGGGVYLAGSSANLFMYGKALIGDSATSITRAGSTYGNKATVNGGGIYNNGGNVYIGYDEEGHKEAVYSDAGLWYGVRRNYATNSTGGIHNASGTLLIASGDISYNYVPNSSYGSPYGGGIYCGDGAVTVNGGTIKGNYAKQGGGIFIKSGASATVNGDVTISENEAGSAGGAVYNNGTFEIGGSVSIPYGAGGVVGAGKNDVYLGNEKFITITEALSASGTVATVTPYEWKRGLVYLKADESKLTDVTAYKEKFDLTKDGWDKDISSDKLSAYISQPIYVAGSSGRKICSAPLEVSAGADGTKLRPYSKIADALADTTADFGVITIDGTVTVENNQSILSSNVPSGVTEITLKGYKAPSDESSTAKLQGAGSTTLSVLSVNKTGLTVIIQDLTITGGNGSYGGGLAVDAGSVKLTDGAIITGNNATQGGGVFVGDSGTLYVCGKSLIGDSVQTPAGSGSNANSANNGGGIYNRGKVYLGCDSDGIISAAYALETGYGICRNYAQVSGGGIYNMGGTIKIAGGTVSYNKSDAYGGGIFYNGSELKVFGDAVIKGNESVELGGAVYMMEGLFSMGNSAYIPYGSGNDIYAECIKVSQSLTKHKSDDKVKFIPKPSQLGQQYIIASSGVTLSDEVAKFECNHSDFKLFTNGRVARQVFYIANDGNDAGYAASDTPLATLPELFSRINTQYTDNGLGEAIVCTIIVKGEVGSPDTGLEFPDGRLTSLLLRGYNDNPTITFNGSTFGGITDKLLGGGSHTVLNLNMNAPVTIRNLMITGAYGVDKRGIYMKKGNLTLDTGAIICGNTAHVPDVGGWGGGIYQCAGEVTLKTGAYISLNLADGLGGGVAVAGGKFILEGGEISYNKQSLHTGGGGGVYVHQGATLHCKSGFIKNNQLTILTGDASGSGVLRQNDSTTCIFDGGNPAVYIFDNYPDGVQYDSRGW